jgi:hypothetical protein
MKTTGSGNGEAATATGLIPTGKLGSDAGSGGDDEEAALASRRRLG